MFFLISCIFSCLLPRPGRDIVDDRAAVERLVNKYLFRREAVRHLERALHLPGAEEIAVKGDVIVAFGSLSFFAELVHLQKE